MEVAVTTTISTDVLMGRLADTEPLAAKEELPAALALADAAAAAELLATTVAVTVVVCAAATRATFVLFRLPPLRNAGTSVWFGPGAGSG